jgi:hypothetical protein
VKLGSLVSRVVFTTTALKSLVVPSAAEACGLFDSSCKNPTISARGQVFIAVLIALILGGLLAWRLGKPRSLVRVMAWMENRRLKRAGRPNSP